jgi:indole-3-glycerol phosphate synthase
MANVLEEICATKLDHIKARKDLVPMASMEGALALASPVRGFALALKDKVASGGYGLIAEIKKASPSKGLIREDFDPSALAQAYEAGGATCLSVLTDIPYFQGDDVHLVEAQRACKVPLLRKDFMLDPYQVTEARVLGADCILLIMACLEDSQALELADCARALGMDVLVEVHDAAELDRSLLIEDALLGINNRNLKTMETTLQTTRDLAAIAPKDRLLVGESGIGSHDDVLDLANHGVQCFLVGESLMRQDDVTRATQALLGLN